MPRIEAGVLSEKEETRRGTSSTFNYSTSSSYRMSVATQQSLSLTKCSRISSNPFGNLALEYQSKRSIDNRERDTGGTQFITTYLIRRLASARSSYSSLFQGQALRTQLSPIQDARSAQQSGFSTIPWPNSATRSEQSGCQHGRSVQSRIELLCKEVAGLRWTRCILCSFLGSLSVSIAFHAGSSSCRFERLPLAPGIEKANLPETGSQLYWESSR